MRGRREQKSPDPGGYQSFGHVGQRAGDKRERPSAADIGERDQERGVSLDAAQRAHQRARILRRGRGTAAARQKRAQLMVRAAVEKSQCTRGVGADKVPKVRRELGDPANEPRQRRMRGNEPAEPPAGCRVLDARKPLRDARTALSGDAR